VTEVAMRADNQAVDPGDIAASCVQELVLYEVLEILGGLLVMGISRAATCVEDHHQEKACGTP